MSNIHEQTAKALGVSYQDAKNINYMILYGGGPSVTTQGQRFSSVSKTNLETTSPKNTNLKLSQQTRVRITAALD